MMKVYARQRYIPTSARKLRRVINLIRGKKVLDAYAILRSTPFAATTVVLAKLTEAVASAHQQQGLAPQDLFVCEVCADDGSTQKRFHPRAQGRVNMRQKRTCHISLAVSKQLA